MMPSQVRCIRCEATSSSIFWTVRSRCFAGSPPDDSPDIQAEAHGIVIAQDCVAGLPQVLGDRIQLQQVIINLLVNAIQAMSCRRPGCRHLRVTTAALAEGQVVLRVEDTGPGIDAGKLDKLFEAFYTTREQGLGMGLSICRSIVEAHGGSIWAESRAESPMRSEAQGGQHPAGPGAAFSFTLPVL